MSETVQLQAIKPRIIYVFNQPIRRRVYNWNVLFGAAFISLSTREFIFKLPAFNFVSGDGWPFA